MQGAVLRSPGEPGSKTCASRALEGYVPVSHVLHCAKTCLRIDQPRVREDLADVCFPPLSFDFWGLQECSAQGYWAVQETCCPKIHIHVP